MSKRVSISLNSDPLSLLSSNTEEETAIPLKPSLVVNNESAANRNTSNKSSEKKTSTKVRTESLTIRVSEEDRIKDALRDASKKLKTGSIFNVKVDVGSTGTLGIGVKDFDTNLLAVSMLKRSNGVVGAGEAAGIRLGDIIFGINFIPTRDGSKTLLQILKRENNKKRKYLHLQCWRCHQLCADPIPGTIFLRAEDMFVHAYSLYRNRVFSEWERWNFIEILLSYMIDDMKARMNLANKSNSNQTQENLLGDIDNDAKDDKNLLSQQNMPKSDTMMLRQWISMDLEKNILQAKGLRTAICVRIVHTKTLIDTVIYVLRVEDVETGLQWVVHRRYRDFYSLHEELLDMNALVKDISFPRKTLSIRNSPKLIETRIVALEQYIRRVLFILTVYATMDPQASRSLRHVQFFLGVDKYIDCIHPPLVDDQRYIELMAYRYLNDFSSPSCQQCIRFVTTVDLDEILQENIQNQLNAIRENHSDGNSGNQTENDDSIYVYRPVLQHMNQALTEVQNFLLQQHNQQLTTALKERSSNFTSFEDIRVFVRKCVRRQVEAAVYLPLRRIIFRIVYSFLANKAQQLQQDMILLQQAEPGFFGVDSFVLKAKGLSVAIKAFHDVIQAYLPADQGQLLMHAAAQVANLHTECKEYRKQQQEKLQQQQHDEKILSLEESKQTHQASENKLKRDNNELSLERQLGINPDVNQEVHHPAHSLDVTGFPNNDISHQHQNVSSESFKSPNISSQSQSDLMAVNDKQDPRVSESSSLNDDRAQQHRLKRSNTMSIASLPFFGGSPTKANSTDKGFGSEPPKQKRMSVDFTKLLSNMRSSSFSNSNTPSSSNVTSSSSFSLDIGHIHQLVQQPIPQLTNKEILDDPVSSDMFSMDETIPSYNVLRQQRSLRTVSNISSSSNELNDINDVTICELNAHPQVINGKGLNDELLYDSSTRSKVDSVSLNSVTLSPQSTERLLSEQGVVTLTPVSLPSNISDELPPLHDLKASRIPTTVLDRKYRQEGVNYKYGILTDTKSDSTGSLTAGPHANSIRIGNGVSNDGYEDEGVDGSRDDVVGRSLLKKNSSKYLLDSLINDSKLVKDSDDDSSKLVNDEANMDSDYVSSEDISNLRKMDIDSDNHHDGDLSKKASSDSLLDECIDITESHDIIEHVNTNDMDIMPRESIQGIYEASLYTQQQSIVSADDFLPLFTYVLVHSSLPQLLLVKELMTSLVDEEETFGECGYYLATLEASTQHITDLAKTLRNQLRLEGLSIGRPEKNNEERNTRFSLHNNRHANIDLNQPLLRDSVASTEFVADTVTPVGVNFKRL